MQLRTLGEDTLARMEATLHLTETMYKEGAGKVQKTDFLDNKVMVETLRAMVALLEKNEEMAQAALANTMGLSWNTFVKPADSEVPYDALQREPGKPGQHRLPVQPGLGQGGCGTAGRGRRGAHRQERNIIPSWP